MTVDPRVFPHGDDFRRAAVLDASAEHEDLAHLCDRVVVFRRGRIVRERAGPAVTKGSITAACYAQAG
jgi:ribose transport system ATP-binding protein